MEETPKTYDMTALMQLTPEFLLGDENNPGPLVTLAYPDILRMREVSRDAKRITDMDYFWELKTRRDFGAENRYPQRGNWKEEYLRYGEELAPELIEASREGNGSKVRELLDLGVNPNARNEYGVTALKEASRKGRTEIVEQLLASGVDVNHPNLYGDTALMNASEDGHPEIVRMLLDKGAKVNLIDKFGNTALIGASYFGHSDIIRFLLEAGADVSLKNEDGKTALDIAEEGEWHTADILRRAMV